MHGIAVERPQNTGCCIVASRTAWLLADDFDERLFLIFEDSDWSMRAAARGVQLVVARDCQLLHHVSRSFRSRSAGLLATFYFARNGLVFSFRHRRRFTMKFAWKWVLKPVARSVVRRDDFRRAALLCAGALAAGSGQRGRAPKAVDMLVADRGFLRARRDSGLWARAGGDGVDDSGLA